MTIDDYTLTDSGVVSPCPFCAGKARPYHMRGMKTNTPFWGIEVAHKNHCVMFGVEIPARYQTPEDAIEAWNRRAQ